jgi:hypothetical protein
MGLTSYKHSGLISLEFYNIIIMSPVVGITDPLVLKTDTQETENLD